MSESDDWHGTLGRFGLGKRNEAGEVLLQFAQMNELSFLNTSFMKKDIHLGTWMHPATKQFHAIDFVLMRRSISARCVDAQVMHSITCRSDHMLVRA